MQELSKVCLALTAWTLLFFFIGLAIGEKLALESNKKVILELSIELTKLKIKKLEGVK